MLEYASVLITVNVGMQTNIKTTFIPGLSAKAGWSLEGPHFKWRGPQTYQLATTHARHIIRTTCLKFFDHITHADPSMDHSRVLRSSVASLLRDWNCCRACLDHLVKWSMIVTSSTQEAFEKCWSHSPLRAAACPNFTLPFTRCRYCRTPPAHRCPRQRRQQQRVTGPLWPRWNGPKKAMPSIA